MTECLAATNCFPCSIAAELLIYYIVLIPSQREERQPQPLILYFPTLHRTQEDRTTSKFPDVYTNILTCCTSSSFLCSERKWSGLFQNKYRQHIHTENKGRKSSSSSSWTSWVIKISKEAITTRKAPKSCCSCSKHSLHDSGEVQHYKKSHLEAFFLPFFSCWIAHQKETRQKKACLCNVIMFRFFFIKPVIFLGYHIF